jgi:hypothetical protein
MIDFKEELDKYKPVLSMEDVEDAVREIASDEFRDIMDLLQYISGKLPNDKA